MRSTNISNNIRLAIFLVGVILISNGCGLADSLNDSQATLQIFERSLFESLQGIY